MAFAPSETMRLGVIVLNPSGIGFAIFVYPFVNRTEPNLHPSPKKFQLNFQKISDRLQTCATSLAAISWPARLSQWLRQSPMAQFLRAPAPLRLFESLPPCPSSSSADRKSTRLHSSHIP